MGHTYCLRFHWSVRAIAVLKGRGVFVVQHAGNFLYCDVSGKWDVVVSESLRNEEHEEHVRLWAVFVLFGR